MGNGIPRIGRDPFSCHGAHGHCRPEDVLEGYVLQEQLGSKGWYIETWRATDARGDDMVLKIHTTCVSDDCFSENDLTDAVADLVPRFDLLVSLPPVPGLAGWLRYRFNRERKYLVFCRRYYPTRLTDRFPIPGTEPDIGPPRTGLLQAIKEIAGGVDFLEQHIADFTLRLSNLFVDQSHAFVADFGVQSLHCLIEEGYAGPRRSAVSLDTVLSSLSGQPALAAIYFYLRTGRLPFDNLRWDPSRDSLMKCHLAVESYHRTGSLSLDSLPAIQERETVRRALSRDPLARFRSCLEFVNVLQTSDWPANG